MTHVGNYTSIRGTAFEVIKSEGCGFIATFGDRRFGFDQVESADGFSEAVRATGASHLIRSGLANLMLTLDKTTATRLAADMVAAHDAAVAAALAEPGARYAVAASGSARDISVGVARVSGGEMASDSYIFRTLADLPHIRFTDLSVTKYFGSTNQGDGLIEVTEEEVERLRDLNDARALGRADQIAQHQAVETERNATIAMIPADVVQERATLRREYNGGQNEGGDGYDPYATWWSPSSMALLQRRAPELAAKLKALGEG